MRGDMRLFRLVNSDIVEGSLLNLTQKSQYALRAMFALAKREGEGPMSVAAIAEAQAIPPRFLELILRDLRTAGYVASRRGPTGGYSLASPAASRTVGDIIRLMQGSLDPVQCIENGEQSACPLVDNCVFLGLWTRARDAVSEVYDKTTLRDLVEEERQARP